MEILIWMTLLFILFGVMAIFGKLVIIANILNETREINRHHMLNYQDQHRKY